MREERSFQVCIKLWWSFFLTCQNLLLCYLSNTLPVKVKQLYNTWAYSFHCKKRRDAITRNCCIDMWKSWAFNWVILRCCKFIYRDILDEYPSQAFKSHKTLQIPNRQGMTYEWIWTATSWRKFVSCTSK